MSTTWHDSTLKHISSILKANNAVISLYVFGSFAEVASDIDHWSDLDLLIIVQDDAINKIYPNLDWLSSLGKIFAYEQSSNKYQHVSKIIFEDNSFKTYSTKGELGKELGFKGNFTQSQLDKKLQLKYLNIKHILYNLCPLEW